jgi:hypothetical protein
MINSSPRSALVADDLEVEVVGVPAAGEHGVERSTVLAETGASSRARICWTAT